MKGREVFCVDGALHIVEGDDDSLVIMDANSTLSDVEFKAEFAQQLRELQGTPLGDWVRATTALVAWLRRSL